MYLKYKMKIISLLHQACIIVSDSGGIYGEQEKAQLFIPVYIEKNQLIQYLERQ